mmetsp:Transcript_29295/g.48422  ORF Transcript_29295/g.48422 Transcript_29295/m.48422 type:complete len:215 (-) Transcript_29295:30-674(-)|eukprot:CAMPEP_0119003630 /NCGR_PEP_ID=MMETSP1176-20130426/679_1 /TAXON_ID=265551 /ORGANISM="Synedropsis recta cf, Strain CCMP1620" /LENGTH=214 /DNA_ID=CAMNT_0006955247 /DNA_START=38 /DNA_END=682 /DNA_ORIENTATION=-
MKLGIITTLNILLLVTATTDTSLRGVVNDERNLGPKHRTATVEPTAIGNEGAAPINTVTWEIDLTVNIEESAMHEVECTDPYQESNVMPLWTFLKVTAEHAATNWLIDHGGRTDEVWELADAPDYEGTLEGLRRLEHQDGGHRSLRTFGFRYFSPGSCRSCNPDHGGDSRRLGDSQRTGKTLSDVVARNLYRALRHQCSHLANISQVSLKLLID